MLRSSRIPPLLNRICTDGIISSYLITIDGELLGCSNIQPSKTNTSTSTSTSAKKNGNDIPSMQINVPSSSEEMMMMMEEPSNTNTFTNTNTNTNTWENMDPSDIGALVAEVVEDYKRLGLELALLTPSSDVNGNGSGNGNGNGSGSGNKQNSAAVSAGGNTSGGSIGIGIGKDMNGRSGKDKDRGKLNCLIVEMEKGLVGIAAATSDTYVVGLTDSTAEHGSLKMKLLSLSAYVRDAFLPLDKGSL